MSIKVMLADDHVLMREGIRQLLEFDGTISVVAEANNGVECMEQLLSVHPDILSSTRNKDTLFRDVR